MKLKVFDISTAPQYDMPKRLPTIFFSHDNVITISSVAAAKMEIKGGDRISFAQDQADPQEWYVFKSENGFKCNRCSDKPTLTFSHAGICRRLRGFFSIDSRSFRFILAGQPTVIDGVTYFGLIRTGVEF
jgi:hypothetical protein